jgi:hypothetical protein
MTGSALKIARTKKGRPQSRTPQDDYEKAQAFNQFFYKKVEAINAQLSTAPSLSGGPDTARLESVTEILYTFNSVSLQEIKRHIQHLSKKTAPQDPIPVHLITTNSVMPNFLRFLCEKSFSEGVFPESCKKAVVTPVIKKHNLDRDEMSNFRPVSNMKFTGKLLECVAAHQLRHHLEKVAYLHPHQSAYRAFHSTETATVKVCSDWRAALDKGMYVLVVSLDVTAAFDTVDHRILLKRLIQAGVMGRAYNWIQSYLTDRTAAVKFGAAVSLEHPLKSGVPQGSILGPTLFNVYMADLGRLLSSGDINFHIYADDVLLYKPCYPDNVTDAINSLRDCLQQVESWMLQNRLLLSPTKTSAFLFHCPRAILPSPPLSVIIGGVQVGFSTSSPLRWLGVDFDPHLKMCAFVDRTSRSCFSILQMLRRLRSSMNRHSTLLLCNSLVCSRLEYCGALLFSVEAAQLERLCRVQNLAARIVSGCRRYDHVSPIIREIGWRPTIWLPTIKLIILVAKVLRGRAPAYLSCEVYQPRRSLRSSQSTSIQLVLGTAHKNIGKGVWSVAAPMAWNSLPENLRDKDITLQSFFCRLKGHKF